MRKKNQMGTYDIERCFSAKCSCDLMVVRFANTKARKGPCGRVLSSSVYLALHLASHDFIITLTITVYVIQSFIKLFTRALSKYGDS